MFFSTFEELKLPATGPMDRATVTVTTKLYEPSPTPILYVAPCENMLGRVPLFPCFLRGRPRLGGLSVSETKDKREAVVRAGAKRSQEPLRRSEAARRRGR